jgi:hypothetical protein
MRDTVVVQRWITAWRTERVTLPCPLPPGAALRHLAAGIDARRHRHLRPHLYAGVEFVILGRADDGGVRICAARPHVTNDFRTYLYARVVPDGSGSRIEGRLGWRPAVRLTVVALVVSLVLLWFGLLGYVGRSLFAGGPILQQASGLIVIPVILAALAGLIALCERLARPEAAHLRAWLTGRLDVPAPPPRTAPVPRPPAPPPAVRPPIPT